MLHRIVFTAVFIAAIPAASAVAQQEIDDARKNARLHVGGLYIMPTFQLKEFGLDSNVFNLFGEQSPDFTATLTPGAAFFVPVVRRALFTARVDTDFVYYQKYASERSINPNVSLRATGFFHRLTLFAGGNYVNTHERLNEEIDARARRTNKGVDAGIQIRVTPKVTTTLAGHAGRIEFAANQVFREVDLRESLAEDLRSVDALISYRATPYTTFALRAEAEQERFLFSTFKDADSYRVMPGIDLQARALISGSAYVGFRRFQPLNALIPEFRGVVASTALRYTLRSATAFTVSVDRDVHFSYQSLNPYFVSTSAGLLIRRQLVGSFDATAGVQRIQNDYQDILTSTLRVEPPRVDVTHNYSTDIGYRLGRRGRFGVGVSYWERGSNRADEVAYSGLRVGSTVKYGF